MERLPIVCSKTVKKSLTWFPFPFDTWFTIVTVFCSDSQLKELFHLSVIT